jgi:hypothetical protein
MPSFRTNLIAVLFVGLAAVAAADAPDDLPRLRMYTQSSPPFLRFAIVDGRLTLKCRTPNNFQVQTNHGNGQKETLSLRSDRGQSALTYERISAKEQIKISVAGAGAKTCIERAPRDTSSFVPMEFQQAPGENTTLTLGTGDRRQVFQAADFWRLAIVHQKQCQEHLFPLLDKLRPDWKLAAMVARVESILIARASEDSQANEKRWAKLVLQLGDDQFTRREAADRALRAGGPSALNYLRQLDFEKLDAEQQFRVRRILAALGGRSDDDSADETAASLAHDPAVWLALLGRPELATRQLAVGQLTKLLGHPIDVDPAVDPDSQKTKREKLQAKIEKK